MSRLVTASTKSTERPLDGGALQKGIAPGGKPLEDYLERVAKYVPVEIIAAFMAIRSFVPERGTSGAVPAGAEIAIFAALLVMTPLYLIKFGGDAPNKRRQIAISCVSFVVWSYAIGGPFFWAAVESLADCQVVYSGIAGAAVVVWSLAAGLIKPTAAT